jgi:hypothetical protein
MGQEVELKLEGPRAAIGKATGQEQTEIAPCIAAVVKSAKRLERVPAFW